MFFVGSGLWVWPFYFSDRWPWLFLYVALAFLFLTAVGFEPTQFSLVELESTPLDHSGKLSCWKVEMLGLLASLGPMLTLDVRFAWAFIAQWHSVSPVN